MACLPHVSIEPVDFTEPVDELERSLPLPWCQGGEFHTFDGIQPGTKLSVRVSNPDAARTEERE